MNKPGKKKALRFFLIVMFVCVLCYLLYCIYDIAVESAVLRIKQGVAEGVKQGMRDAVNPFKWFRKK